MKIIVGLGNPGEKYEATRHNLGFMVIDQFFKNFERVKNTTWALEDKFKSEIAIIDWESRSAGSRQAISGNTERLILAKPQTYMNNSGLALSLLSSYYKIDPQDVWVIHDELDLPLGSLKIRNGGSGAGHHGIESIMQQLGTEKFWRFRMGIGVSRNKEELANHKMRDVDDFVLGTFDRGESGKLGDMIKRGAKALATALEESLEAAMNQYNTK